LEAPSGNPISRSFRRYIQTVAVDRGAFPPAEGRRVDWHELPASVRAGIEGRLDAEVVSATTRPAGFSPGLAARLETAAGDRLFVKAVSGDTNPISPQLHRREAHVASLLPADAPAPRFRWWFELGPWVVLGFDYVEGANPELPWRRPDLDRVLDALSELARTLTPSPAELETVGERLGTTLLGWRDLAVHQDDLARIPPLWQRRLDELVELETHAPIAAAGDTLVHLDIRADNILLTDTGVMFVDWPFAAIGAPWLDLVAMLPSVAMQGGPDPEEVWRRHPLSSGVDREAVDAFLAGLAGMFTRQSLLPPSPGVETVRRFQSAQGHTARAWLAHRRGWTDALP